MAKEINISESKVVEVLKKNPGESIQFYATKLGLPVGQAATVVWKLEHVADPSLAYKGPNTDAAKAKWIVKNSDLRWERLAARVGESISKVKELYESESGESASKRYTGKGRNFAENGGSGGGSGRKASSKASTGRGAKSGTSGRRGAAAAKAGRGAAAKSTGRGTRGTRAGASPK